jgi:chromate transporter
VFAQMALLFSQAAVVTFGGAYAVLGFVAYEAVETYSWITAEDMTVGLGLAETTPGPLILVLQFVGFLAAFSDPGTLPPLLAGLFGAVLTVWVTFLPSFAFVFGGAPFVERIRQSSAVRDALAGIGAAVVGVIAHLGLWFAGHVLFSTFDGRLPEFDSLRWDALALVALASLLLLWRQLRPLVVLAISAGAGLVVTLGLALAAE